MVELVKRRFSVFVCNLLLNSIFNEFLNILYFRLKSIKSDVTKFDIIQTLSDRSPSTFYRRCQINTEKVCQKRQRLASPFFSFSTQGRPHEVLTVSVGDRFPLGEGGTDSGESKPPNPKFVFLVGFRPFYLGNIRK